MPWKQRVAAMAVFGKTIALDPGPGGRSIGGSALMAADIIVSTTRAAISGAIRVATFSVVSHAALYAGDQKVIEAIGEGVVDHSLDDAMREDVLAVAYRSPAITPSIAAAIVAFAREQARLRKPYSVAGVVMSTDPILCRIGGPRTAGFFCSQLVLEAYKRGGLPLTTKPPSCMSPDDVAEIAAHRLTYVGHLKGNLTRFSTFAP